MAKPLLIWFSFLLLAVVLFLMFNRPATGGAMIPTNVAIQQLEAGNVRTMLIESDKLTGELRTPQQLGARKGRIIQFQCSLPQDQNARVQMIRYMLDHRRDTKILIANKQSTGSRIFAWLRSFDRSPGKSHGTAP